MFCITFLFAQTTKQPNVLLTKGIVFFGLSGGASIRETENQDLFIFRIKEQQKSGFNVFVSGGYVLGNDFGVGGAFRYDQSRLTRTAVDQDGIVSDIKEAGTILTSSAYLKYFIPLGASKRINLYNIAGVAWVNDNNLNETLTQQVLTRTYTTINSVQLGFSPGIQVFIIDGFATELGVNIAGISGGAKKVYVNGVEDSKSNRLDIDLKLDILSASISFYYYFRVNN
jgi:hypothetical protein